MPASYGEYLGRDHFGLEAILRKVPGIEGDNEIGLALLGAKTKGIVLGIRRNLDGRTLTSSARSRIRLTSRPINSGRTCKRFRTSLYSSRMSSAMSQTKSLFSAHLRSKSALGFFPSTPSSLKPEMPATSTLVSTATRGLRLLPFGGNTDHRRALLFTISTNSAQNHFF